MRELDPDRYLSSLVIPAEKRADVQALFAFAAEVATVRERVSEPTPGEIRLQWWVDALEGEGHGDVVRNPVADALLKTIKRCALPVGPLVRLLAARRFDLYNDPMPDAGQFEGYAGETVSVLFQYAAMILSGDEATSAAEAAGHLGVAVALAGHLRAFGYNAARGQLFLPLSVFTANGVREADIYAGTDSPELRNAITQFRELAHHHAQKVRSAMGVAPKASRPAFASLALVEDDLARLARHEAPFVPMAAPVPFLRLTRLMWWALRNG
nr:phytoene/squalene synthase family protein [Pelagibacterium limicola]